jgi:hypothetical protein
MKVADIKKHIGSNLSYNGCLGKYIFPGDEHSQRLIQVIYKMNIAENVLELLFFICWHKSGYMAI